MKLTFVALAAALVAVGCSKNPAENVPAADVRPASESAATAPAAARTYVFGSTNGAIEFVGSKVTGKHDGGFRSFRGELHVVNGRIADTGNKVVIDTASLYSDNNRLTGHLKNADFFDVEKFPTSTFVTISVKPGTTNSIVTGNLTLHGITKEISFPADIKVTDDSVSVSAEFVLNRFDFDMKYAGRADDLIRKEVVLKLKLNAVPGKADFQASAAGQPGA